MIDDERGLTTERACSGREKSGTCLIVPIQGLSTSDSSAIHSGDAGRHPTEAEELTTEGFKSIERQRSEPSALAQGPIRVVELTTSEVGVLPTGSRGSFQ